MSQEFPFRNLVFEGGGVKGFAYLGALRVLEERRVLGQIDRVAGASAGAITAMVVSFRLSVEQTIALTNTLDYSQVPQKRSSQDPHWWDHLPKPVLKELEKVVGDLDCVHRLIHRYGWYSSEYFYGWLQGTIEKASKESGQALGPLATFADFRRAGFRDLHVVAADISTHSARLFSVEASPDVPVADAVRMSMSIPLYFESLPFDQTRFGQGDQYNDGGTLLNYPIDVFDDPKYVSEPARLVEGRNLETLGCHLCTPARCPKRQKPIHDLVSFVENLFESLLEAQSAILKHSPADQRRSANISNCCVAATDFHITPGDATYEKLVQSGVTAMSRYLDQYPHASWDCVSCP